MSFKNEQKINLPFGKTHAIQSNENCFNFRYNMNRSSVTAIFSKNVVLNSAMLSISPLAIMTRAIMKDNEDI